MSNEPQSFQNHARMVPGYHYAITLLTLAALAASIAVLVRDPSLVGVTLVLLVLTVTMVGYYARAFPLGVQDRVIRLEERLRLEQILPVELKARVSELTTDQLIGLRFASDGEVAELMRRVLDEGIGDRKAIKALVKSWRPDHQRI